MTLPRISVDAEAKSAHTPGAGNTPPQDVSLTSQQLRLLLALGKRPAGLTRDEATRALGTEPTLRTLREVDAIIEQLKKKLGRELFVKQRDTTRIAADIIDVTPMGKAERARIFASRPRPMPTPPRLRPTPAPRPPRPHPEIVVDTDEERAWLVIDGTPSRVGLLGKRLAVVTALGQAPEGMAYKDLFEAVWNREASASEDYLNKLQGLVCSVRSVIGKKAIALLRSGGYRIRTTVIHLATLPPERQEELLSIDTPPKRRRASRRKRPAAPSTITADTELLQRGLSKLAEGIDALNRWATTITNPSQDEEAAA